MKPISALIVEDESAARSRLRRRLEAVADVRICGEATDGLEAVEQISLLRPDLVFLDIQMPGFSGFEVLRALSAERLLVIFVTGFGQFALNAFEVNAVSYLLRPVHQQKLMASVARARMLIEHADALQEANRNVEQMIVQAESPLRQLVARRRDRYLLLRPSEVVFFRIEDSIVKAVTVAETLPDVTHQGPFFESARVHSGVSALTLAESGRSP